MVKDVQKYTRGASRRPNKRLDFTKFAPRIAEMRTIVYFETLQRPLMLSEFNQALNRLRQLFGNDEVDDQLAAFHADVLNELVDFNESANRRVLEAIRATHPETATERRRRIAQSILSRGGEMATHVRTGASVTFNAAQWQITQSDPTVWGYVYLTQADERVRENHEKAHGMTRDKEDSIWDSWWPPNGWNCRCMAMALRREVRETDLRALGGAEPDEGWDFNAGQIIF